MGSDWPLELVFGASSGLFFIILIFVTIRIIQRRRNVKDVESCGTSTVSDTESDQKSDHSNTKLFNSSANSQANNISMNVTQSSYSGSMRKKKERHYNDLMNIYNTAIIENINTSIYASIPWK